MEGHAGEVGPQFGRRGDDLAGVSGAGAELARKGPVAADVRRGDAQVLLRIGLDLGHPAQLVQAVDHEPLHAFGRRIGDRVARFDRVRIEDLRGRHAQREQEVELGGRGDLEAAAFLQHDLEHTPVWVRLDGVVRAHAGHSRAEAPHLAADDGRVDDQERSGVLLACHLAHDLEVEADLGMRVEEALLRLLPGYCVLSYSCDATRRAIAHISKSPKRSVERT